MDAKTTIMAAITDVQIVRRIQKESATDAPLLNLRVTNEESRTVMITPLSSQDQFNNSFTVQNTCGCENKSE